MSISDEPYRYQQKLAESTWPNMLDIPTGLGKTAAVTLAWIYKRRILDDPDTPRRLVYCLPMRVLVEQTRQNVVNWLENLGYYAKSPEMEGISVHLLMGGENDLKSWSEWPEKEAILIGTQDMLLSRALMRGYGMSRYRWPMDFALLHNDTLWVFDEVQLMGAGLSTSAQLEAFRRMSKTPTVARSLWISATLNRDWLSTVDLKPYRNRLHTLTLSDEETAMEPVRKRREAVKMLRQSDAVLNAETNRSRQAAYLKTLAAQVQEAHDPDFNTLVILNSVERAQRLKLMLDKQLAEPVLLVHARFRAKERSELNKALMSAQGRVIVATQAIEAGVDISSKTLFTELAPWASIVQRLGRCNRAGEHAQARVFWIDIKRGAKLEPPYTDAELDAARAQLEALEGTSVGPAWLPAVEDVRPVYHVLRRKDLLELFNTDPDLSGFDIDISPYIRDGGLPSIQVFWRKFDQEPEDPSAPDRQELCPVSLKQIKSHIKKKEVFAWHWDTLARQWRRVTNEAIRPGMMLQLRCADGGYSETLGFIPGYKDKKKPLQEIRVKTILPDNYNSDRDSEIGRYIPLPAHLADVAFEAESLCKAVGEIVDRVCVVTAARWHDVGKSHPVLQAVLTANGHVVPDEATLWAKSDKRPGGSRLTLSCMRRYFRHELASALAWLKHGDEGIHHDLIAYLIAAHHGKVRMGLRALPDEESPSDARRFARGVWEGDRLPGFDFDGVSLPETELRMDLMELGEGAMGPSWSTRTQRLLDQLGPFRLAWLEMLVRVADWRASAREQLENEQPGDT